VAKANVCRIVVILVFLALLATSLFWVPWYPPLADLVGSPEDLGYHLFYNYLPQLELVALVLLAAMIGAIYLAKKEVPA
jgi:NADH:ubiquinone oxidoreductase subunit 6 (subunit J)